MENPPRTRSRFGQYLGLRVLEKKDSCALLSLDHRAELTNPYGMMHGGVLMSLADSAMAAAMHARFPKGEFFTRQLEMVFKAPACGGKIFAEGKVVDQKLNIYFTEANITDDQGQLLAQSTAMFFLAKEVTG